MVSASALRFLIPKGTWLWRTVLLLGFVFLDFLVTALLCETPYAEANLFVRGLMQTYGILIGLVVFAMAMSVPIYAILVFDSYLIKYTGKYSTKAELFLDVILGWIIAGTHFNGAMSWLWDAPYMTRQVIGFAVYLAIALSAFYLHPKFIFPHAVRKSNPQQTI